MTAKIELNNASKQVFQLPANQSERLASPRKTKDLLGANVRMELARLSATNAVGPEVRRKK